MTEPKVPMRRVAGLHSLRLDGITDLETRARGASVLDIGCNRGLAGFSLYLQGAVKVHGCDNYEEGIWVARELFADIRDVKSKFEVLDLTGGPKAMEAAFGDERYDIVLLLATYHKLKRVMVPSDLTALMRDIGKRTIKYLGWRGTSFEVDANEKEIAALDRDLGAEGLKRVHTSYISADLGVACIWART